MKPPNALNVRNLKEDAEYLTLDGLSYYNGSSFEIIEHGEALTTFQMYHHGPSAVRHHKVFALPVGTLLKFERSVHCSNYVLNPATSDYRYAAYTSYLEFVRVDTDELIYVPEEASKNLVRRDVIDHIDDLMVAVDKLEEDGRGVSTHRRKYLERVWYAKEQFRTNRQNNDIA